jgi:hypothetical protein
VTDTLVAAAARATDEGHVIWTGPLHGTAPSTTVSGPDRHVRRVAFREDRGREAVGVVLMDCSERLCVAAAHMSDTVERTQVRSAFLIAHGLDPYAGECSVGHPWSTNARFETHPTRAFVRVCMACVQARRARLRNAGGTAELDELDVLAALLGRGSGLRRREQVEAARRMTERGDRACEIAAVLGVSDRTVYRWRRIHGWKSRVH